MGVGDKRHAPVVLPPGRTRYPLYRTLGVPQGRSGRVRKSRSLSELDNPTVQVVASRYADWALPASRHCTVRQFFSAIATIWIHFFPHIVSLPYILKIRFPVCFDSSVENSPVMLHVRLWVWKEHPLLGTVQVRFSAHNDFILEEEVLLTWSPVFSGQFVTISCKLTDRLRVVWSLHKRE
jgi:hypothetical protein